MLTITIIMWVNYVGGCAHAVISLDELTITIIMWGTPLACVTPCVVCVCVWCMRGVHTVFVFVCV